MSPVYIRTRTVQSGKRYLVYYRRGGRAFPEEYAGSFKTKREAQIRRDLVAGELAGGRDPKIVLEQLRTPPVEKPGVAAVFDAFIASRVDVGEKAIRQYGNARDRWVPLLGEKRDPHTVTADDIIAGVAELYEDGDGLAPSTIGQYVSNLALAFDFAGVDPNPVRSSRVKLPRGTKTEKAIPSNEAWQLIRSKARKRSQLALDLEECCALRVSEACAIEVGHIDFLEGMLLIPKTKTAAGRRWVPVPRELLDRIEAGLPPLEDRRAGQRALGVRSNEVYYDLRKACVAAGVPEFGTHALRHRRISLWLRHGIDAVQVAAWSGHANPSESTDTYGHTIADPRGDRWREFWLDTYADSRRGAAPVRHEELSE